MSFMMGTGLSAVIAGVVLLAVLPGVSGFAGFSLALGAVLVPARCADRAAVAHSDVRGHGRKFHSTSGANQPDDLRFPTILQ
ncbi:MAG: hypothetical protein WDN04_18480 [Rhodospirillales bacterium]